MSNDEVRRNKDGKVVVCPLVFDTKDITVSKESLRNPNTRLYFESELGSMREGINGTVNLFPSETGFDSGIINGRNLFDISVSTLGEIANFSVEEIIKLANSQNCNTVKFYASRFFNNLIQNSYIIFNNGILSFTHDYILGQYVEPFVLDQQLYLTTGLSMFLDNIYKPLEFNAEKSVYEYNNDDSYFKSPHIIVGSILGPIITAIHKYINDIILNHFDVERFIEDSKANDPELEIEDKHLYISYVYAITNQLIKADIDKLEAVTIENVLCTLENIALDYVSVMENNGKYYIISMRKGTEEIMNKAKLDNVDMYKLSDADRSLIAELKEKANKNI